MFFRWGGIVATVVSEREERSHTVRTVVFLFLLCVAVCAVFFSMGFMVGFNERGSHSGPATEVVGSPSVIPPTVNPPPDSGEGTLQYPSAGHTPPNAAPETEVIPAGGGPVSLAAGKPAGAAPAKDPAARQPAAEPSAPPPSGQGITLQVVALRSKQDAGHVVEILKEKGYPVFLVTPEFSHADDKLFRVVVGPFRAHPEADKAREKLVREGYKPFLRH
jgi:cell division protein FtsN